MNPKLQAGVIPIRSGQVCLVTTRRRRRWVFPKGSHEPHLSLLETAHTEAWEEAGIRGSILPAPLGTYDYVKSDRLHRVTMYLMIVREELAHWPEREMRSRVWLPPWHALERLSEPGLRALFAGLLDDFPLFGHDGEQLLSPITLVGSGAE